MVPHLHLNPVKPTFLRHDEQRFGLGFGFGVGFGWFAASDPTAARGGMVRSVVESGRDNSTTGGTGGGSIGEEEGEGDDEAERAASMVDLVEACSCSLRRKSL